MRKISLLSFLALVLCALTASGKEVKIEVPSNTEVEEGAHRFYQTCRIHIGLLMADYFGDTDMLTRVAEYKIGASKSFDEFVSLGTRARLKSHLINGTVSEDVFQKVRIISWDESMKTLRAMLPTEVPSIMADMTKELAKLDKPARSEPAKETKTPSPE